MRISDWSSDVCSSDLRNTNDGGLRTESGNDASGVSRSLALSPRLAGTRHPDYQALCPEPSGRRRFPRRSEEHTSELQSLMRISYAVFCLKKKIHSHPRTHHTTTQSDTSIL